MSEPIANAGLSAMSDADSLAQTVRRYRREIASALIAVKWHLDTPYPDSPEWTPWTRFVERALRKVDEIPALVDELVGQFEEVKQRLDQAERYEKEEQELAARLREERDEALELARVSEGEAAALRALCAKATFRADQAERENAALREALQRFAETKDDEAQPWIRKFARAALASSGSAPQKTTKPPCGG